MNELIQIIKILEPDEVNELNKHIDSLNFNRNSVFGEKGDTSVVDSIRTSTGTSLDDNHEITQKFHAKINKGLDEYKRRVEKIHYNFDSKVENLYIRDHKRIARNKRRNQRRAAQRKFRKEEEE